MIKYVVHSAYSKDMVWEEFVPVDDRFPCVEIDSVVEGVEIGKAKFVECDDGWYNAFIPEFTLDEIKGVLAAINNVDPSEIEIEWTGKVHIVE